ncbi:hypothetical protein AYI69_g6026, partial [Smittium culicis]
MTIINSSSDEPSSEFMYVDIDNVFMEQTEADVIADPEKNISPIEIHDSRSRISKIKLKFKSIQGNTQSSPAEVNSSSNKMIGSSPNQNFEIHDSRFRISNQKFSPSEKDPTDSASADAMDFRDEEQDVEIKKEPGLSEFSSDSDRNKPTAEEGKKFRKEMNAVYAEYKAETKEYDAKVAAIRNNPK